MKNKTPRELANYHRKKLIENVCLYCLHTAIREHQPGYKSNSLQRVISKHNELFGSEFKSVSDVQKHFEVYRFDYDVPID